MRSIIFKVSKTAAGIPKEYAFNDQDYRYFKLALHTGVPPWMYQAATCCWIETNTDLVCFRDFTNRNSGYCALTTNSQEMKEYVFALMAAIEC